MQTIEFEAARAKAKEGPVDDATERILQNKPLVCNEYLKLKEVRMRN